MTAARRKSTHAVVLLHDPIINKHGRVVTTAVTNMDLHDISRTATTYGAQSLYIVTPVDDQHMLLGRILKHWQTPESAARHPDRVEALSRIVLVKSFDEAAEHFAKRVGAPPQVVMTDARDHDALGADAGKRAGYHDLLERIGEKPWLLVFGTGWGVAPEFFPKVDWFLDPVLGYGGRGQYNHLSVRAAAAAVMDRLLGE